MRRGCDTCSTAGRVVGAHPIVIRDVSPCWEPHVVGDERAEVRV